MRRAFQVTALMVLPFWAGAAERTATEEALEDLSRERCEQAVDGFNRGLKEGDPQAYYWTGAMLHYGLCLKQDPARAVPYLELATKHGVAKAARLLVLTHGLGRGVPQSYAEAGRWTRAGLDIEALAKQGRGKSAVELAHTMPTSSWVSLGVAGTFHALVGDKTTHPSMQSFSYRGSDEGSVEVLVNLGQDGLTYTLSKVTVAEKAAPSGLRARIASTAFRAELEAGFAAAMKELPAYPRPGEPAQYLFEVAFRVR
jgi:hypothetical protein